MRNILLVLFLLLCAPVVGAEMLCPSPGQHEIDGVLCLHAPVLSELSPGTLLLTSKELNLLQESAEQNYGGKLRVMLVDHPCMAKMEQAMREMEYFIHWRRMSSVWTEEEKWDYVRKESKMYAMLAQAKQACWKEKP